MRFSFFLLILLLGTNASADSLESTAHLPIHELMSAATRGYAASIAGDMSLMGDDVAGYKAALRSMVEAKHVIARAAPAALRDSRRNAGLATAVQEFYEATTSLLAAGIPATAKEQASVAALRALYGTKRAALEKQLLDDG